MTMVHETCQLQTYFIKPSAIPKESAVNFYFRLANIVWRHRNYNQEVQKLLTTGILDLVESRRSRIYLEDYFLQYKLSDFERTKIVLKTVEYFTNITTILQVRTANNTNSYVSFFFFRAVIHVMSNRHSFYKYILVVLAFAVTLEFPRFFEMKFNIDNQYITTDLMENPYYVQFNSYWNELFVTGFVPLFTLCYMNLKMFFKIKVST